MTRKFRLSSLHPARRDDGDESGRRCQAESKDLSAGPGHLRHEDQDQGHGGQAPGPQGGAQHAQEPEDCPRDGNGNERP